MMRLQKYMAECGIASRRKSEELIKKGLVKVNGQVVDKLGMEIDPAKDIVSYNGKRITKKASNAYYAVYKPRGIVCTCEDDRGRRTILGYVKHTERRLFPVGRLDYDSEGLVILTDDGDYANRVAHPSRGSEKEYRATLNKAYSQQLAEQLMQGVDIGDMRPAGAKKVAFSNRSDGRATINIILSEGRNRQLRRMLEAQGYDILRLTRIRIGQLELGDMKPGTAKRLSREDAEKALQH
jgi:pseudouridine synthase